jgi:SPP1 family predicted phage head-tail adaptor
MTQPNRKRYRITIQTPVETQDETGQPTIVWKTFKANEPAEYTPMNGVEVMRGRQLEANTKALFKVNFCEGYTPQMRVLFDGQVFGISNVNPVAGMRREIELMVKQ